MLQHRSDPRDLLTTEPSARKGIEGDPHQPLVIDWLWRNRRDQFGRLVGLDDQFDHAVLLPIREQHVVELVTFRDEEIG